MSPRGRPIRGGRLSTVIAVMCIARRREGLPRRSGGIAPRNKTEYRIFDGIRLDISGFLFARELHVGSHKRSEVGAALNPLKMSDIKNETPVEGAEAKVCETRIGAWDEPGMREVEARETLEGPFPDMGGVVSLASEPRGVVAPAASNAPPLVKTIAGGVPHAHFRICLDLWGRQRLWRIRRRDRCRARCEGGDRGG